MVDDYTASPQPADTVRVQLSDPQGHVYEDTLAEEVPLSLFVQGESYAVFMRTPGADRALICGFLLTEQLIEDLDDVQSITPCASYPHTRLHLNLESGVRLVPRSRHSFISSSCGVCSLSQLNLEADAPRLERDPLWEGRSLSSADLKRHLEQFNQLPSLFSRTGGAHIAALFNRQGEPRYSQDDVGRHNAVDKVIGAAHLDGERSLSGWVLVVSSRAGFEIVNKAVTAQVGALVTLGAASGAAHRYAVASGLPLYSFARPNRAHVHVSLTSRES